MKTHSNVDTTLFTMIIATVIAGICISGASSLFDSQKPGADTLASKAPVSKQI